MKTTMNIKVMGYRLWVIGMMALLPMLVNAVEYKNKSTYSGIYSQRVYGIAATATIPSTTFQSTSPFSQQWAGKEDVQSMLNADGSLNGNAYMASTRPQGHIRKADANGDGYDDDTGLPVNPFIDEDDEGNVPLGDAALPLLLLALAYAGTRRREREA